MNLFEMLLAVKRAGIGIILQPEIDEIKSLIPTGTSPSNLLVNNDILQEALNLIPTGLRPPVEIELESSLPDASTFTSDDIGLFWIIQIMDVTAAGHTGKAWVNYEDGDSKKPIMIYKVYDHYYSADGESVVLTPAGQLTVSSAWINGVIAGLISIHDTNPIAHSAQFAAKQNQLSSSQLQLLDQTPWFDLVLQNGAVAVSGIIPRYRRTGNRLELEAAIAFPTVSAGISLIFATLPAGFRALQTFRDWAVNFSNDITDGRLVSAFVNGDLQVTTPASGTLWINISFAINID